jgi:hypothetical protein
MKTVELTDDLLQAAFRAWNKISTLLEEDHLIFEDFDEFSSFYKVIMEKIHEEESE